MSWHDTSEVSMLGRQANVLRWPAHENSELSTPGRHRGPLYEFIPGPPAVVSARITEAGDGRITEAGDRRIVE